MDTGLKVYNAKGGWGRERQTVHDGILTQGYKECMSVGYCHFYFYLELPPPK